MRRYEYFKDHEYIQRTGRQRIIGVDVYLTEKNNQFTIDIPRLKIHTSCKTVELIEEEILRSVNEFIVLFDNSSGSYLDSSEDLGLTNMMSYSLRSKPRPIEMEPEYDVTRILKIEDSPIESDSSIEIKMYTFEYVLKYNAPELVNSPDS